MHRGFRFMRLNSGSSNSKSFMLSPQNNIEKQTRPSLFGTSNNTSFDVNCFSFNNEETLGSGVQVIIGADGQASNYVKIGMQQFQLVSPKNQDISGLLRNGSRIVLLENSAEQFQDIDEESLQDEASLEEIKVDDQPRGLPPARVNKK
jgi:hypothetical protein